MSLWKTRPPSSSLGTPFCSWWDAVPTNYHSFKHRGRYIQEKWNDTAQKPHNKFTTFSKRFTKADKLSFFSLFHTIGDKPLLLWNKKIRAGHICRVIDADLNASVLELFSSAPKNSYITCPENQKKTLGIRLSILNLTVKNLGEPFSFALQILDDRSVERRFCFSTDLRLTSCKNLLCSIPLILLDGWNEIILNLQNYTKAVFGTNYKETLRLQINANCRIRRVYFSHKICDEEEIPITMRLYNYQVKSPPEKGETKKEKKEETKGNV